MITQTSEKITQSISPKDMSDFLSRTERVVGIPGGFPDSKPQQIEFTIQNKAGSLVTVSANLLKDDGSLDRFVCGFRFKDGSLDQTFPDRSKSPSSSIYNDGELYRLFESLTAKTAENFEAATLPVDHRQAGN